MEDGKEYHYHEPVQSPINPPYSEACLLRKMDRLAKPDLGASSCREMSACETLAERSAKLLDTGSHTCSTAPVERTENVMEDSTSCVVPDDNC